MPTISLLDAQESLAREFNAEIEYEKERPKTLPTLYAFPKDINCTQDRRGMPYRTYDKSRKKFQR